MNPLPPLSLYIHMPWCVSKCPYCDFNSHELRGAMDEDRYIEALLADLDNDLAYTSGRSIATIFIGGGTPSLFSYDALDRLLRGVRERIPLNADCEITMEANPESLSYEYCVGLKQIGIGRLSVGVQSFNNSALQSLGRPHDGLGAMKAVQSALDAGFDNLNIDLMFGLPEQSHEQGMEDVRKAIALQPSHISYYQLTIEPNTKFYKSPPTLPEHDDIYALQTAAIALLQENGYQQYEVSAFGRKQCAHNLNYWRFGDYLGIGAGAHGKISLALPERIIRTRKTRQPMSYIESALNGKCRVLDARIPQSDLIFEFLLNALRLTDGVEKELFSKHTGLPEHDLKCALAEHMAEGHIDYYQPRLKLEPHAYPFLNQILEDCLPKSRPPETSVLAIAPEVSEVNESSDTPSQ